MPINNGIINQKGTPAFYSDIFANRPAFGYAGRVFISTDTGAIYEDTGTAWTLIADAGAGTTGTLQQVTTNGNTTTLGIQVQGIDINDGAGTGANNMAIGSSALANNTTGISNTAIGFVALTTNTTGGGNVGVGFNALQFNTTGGDNTAIGSQSLKANTTGNFNTAVGSLSLPANTTGNYNTALGMQSLYNNSTGANNTALGQGALALNTTASNNTAVGNASLSANTTGASNTAIGSSALNGNTTASNNTAIGYQSLYLNTTGASQTAIGSGSLQNNTTGTSNTAIGSSALQNNSTGTQNTAIGSSALSLNTTGGNNTANGFVALQNNTTGSNNTALGVSALASNTTASQNTAVGNSSMSANTTGSLNTAVGQGSMQTNSTGQTNTAVGTSSMLVNTTGSANTAIGYLTLGANTTSNNNTAIGYASLQVNTGAGNTGIGYGSLSSNTTGGNNVAIGNSALIGNTTASNNTAIGTTALGSATTGTQNTAIGLNAGVNITTGSGNTFIGYNSGFGITTGSDNTILGYAGTLSAALTSNIVLSDGAGNVRLFSDANGLIGINQAVGSTIGGQLDIHTTQTYALVLNGLTTSNAYTAFSNNNVGKWRIGNTYNAGANSFDIFNLGTSATNLSITSAGQLVTGGAPVGDWSMRVIGNSTAGNSYGLKVLGGTNSSDVAFSVTPQSGSVNYFQIKGDGFSTFFKSLTAESIGTGTPAFYAKADSGSNNGTYGFGNDNNYRIRAGSDYGAMIFDTAGADRMYLFSDGNMSLGNNTNTGYRLYIAGDLLMQTNGKITSNGGNLSIGSGGATDLYLSNQGTAYWALSYGLSYALVPTSDGVRNLGGSGNRLNTIYATNGTINTSDIREKQNISKSDLGLEFINKLNPVKYNWLNCDKKNHYGLIAQDIENLKIDNFGALNIENDKFGLNYIEFIAPMIKAIQELKAQLDALKNN